MNDRKMKMAVISEQLKQLREEEHNPKAQAHLDMADDCVRKAKIYSEDKPK